MNIQLDPKNANNSPELPRVNGHAANHEKLHPKLIHTQGDAELALRSVEDRANREKIILDSASELSPYIKRGEFTGQDAHDVLTDLANKHGFLSDELRSRINRRLAGTADGWNSPSQKEATREYHRNRAAEEHVYNNPLEPAPKKERKRKAARGETGVAALSDDTLALDFTKRHAGSLKYIDAWGKWFQFDGKKWQADSTLLAFDLARKACRDVAASVEANAKDITSAKTIAAVERLAKSDREIAATVDQWDADPWLINTPNGVVDLRTGKVREHDPLDYMTKITAVQLSVGCPLWLKFIARITNDDPELAAFLQRMLGYALTGVTKEHALFFLYGTGTNGKSVLISTVAGILGDYHTPAPIETFTAAVGERHPTELASLQGARLVTAVETQEGRRWDETKIKTLTGGDKISARFMRQDFFEYTPQFKLIIAGNHKPGLRTVDEAIRRRFHFVPFTVTIPANKIDKELTQKLKAEWPGVLAWMIEGCLEWQRIGLAPPAAVRDATDTYLAAEDAIATWIIDECERDPQSWSTSTDLFVSWTAWATRTGETIGTMKSFVQNLEDRNFEPQRRMNGRGFLGIRVRTHDQFRD